MLNYSSKGINTIVIGISLILTIILFIFLDILIINPKNSKEVNNITVSKYIKQEDKTIIKTENRENINAVKVNDTMQKFMQIADIYENVNVQKENIKNEEKENKKTVKYINKNKWRIEIPKIGVNAPIKTGTTQEILATSVGLFEESSKYDGNIALAGHNRGYNCNFFENIKKLREGDKIIYHTEKGRREYRVILNKIIHQTDCSYVENTQDNRITLITCVENMYEYRRCVQAVEISEKR